LACRAVERVKALALLLIEARRPTMLLGNQV